MLCADTSFAPSLPADLNSAAAISKCAKALSKLMYLYLFLTLSLTSPVAAYVCKGFATVDAKLSEQLPLIVTCTLGGFVYIQAWWVRATEVLDFWKDCFKEKQKLWGNDEVPNTLWKGIHKLFGTLLLAWACFSSRRQEYCLTYIDRSVKRVPSRSAQVLSNTFETSSSDPSVELQSSGAGFEVWFVRLERDVGGGWRQDVAKEMHRWPCDGEISYAEANTEIEAKES